MATAGQGCDLNASPPLRLESSMAMRDALLPEFDQAMANTSNGDKQSEKPSRKRCHLRTTAPAAWQPRGGIQLRKS